MQQNVITEKNIEYNIKLKGYTVYFLGKYLTQHNFEYMSKISAAKRIYRKKNIEYNNKLKVYSVLYLLENI